jgi:hypothetical protein
MRGLPDEVLKGGEIYGHSRVLRENRWQGKCPPRGADAATPLIGAAARGGWGGGGASRTQQDKDVPRSLVEPARGWSP